MKFVVASGQYKNRGTPSFDKDFKGPITKQIRAARTFLRETSFFERFQHRKIDSGFAEQPELPPIAVDEAIVNAVAHRDYYTKNPIECEHYTDAFVVKNPGRVLQRNVDLLSEHTGYESEEMHEILKSEFAPVKEVKLGNGIKIIRGCTHD